MLEPMTEYMEGILHWYLYKINTHMKKTLRVISIILIS